ncbi:IclR family transcriptional regulator [Streptomyces oceani]|uniref:Glycerol operon regulatory protein n=1 Tax=Streptomyces oceani TaxID=1075402 RepID=A0A1E7KN72_9ACTN|nr:IclR family transcriptional regulator [Streptomyces oceani]OEV05360.1 IclR family transcriptional regulator [Streptomyces oceani]
MSNTSGERPATSVQAVDRAVTVLEILARRHEAGITEIATELGVHKSTAFRLVGALAARGLVEQKEQRGRYRLGFALIKLGGANRTQPDPLQVATPVCEQLAEDVGETVNLAVYEGGGAANIVQVPGPAAVITQNWIGRRTPLHATSSGKVLLAYADSREQAEALEEPLERYTAATLCDPEALREELSTIFRQGYGFAHEEFEIGLNAVAAPVCEADSSVTFALSASGPAYRLTAQRLPDAAKEVVAAAEKISWLLGYLPPE